MTLHFHLGSPPCNSFPSALTRLFAHAYSSDPTDLRYRRRTREVNQVSSSLQSIPDIPVKDFEHLSTLLSRNGRTSASRLTKHLQHIENSRFILQCRFEISPLGIHGEGDGVSVT